MTMRECQSMVLITDGASLTYGNWTNSVPWNYNYAGRRGAGSLSIIADSAGEMVKTFPVVNTNSVTYYIGIAMKRADMAWGIQVQFRGTDGIVHYNFTILGTVLYFGSGAGNSQVASGITWPANDVWGYYEFAIKYNPGTNHDVAIRLNGTLIYTGSANTSTGNNLISSVGFTSRQTNLLWLTDYYHCDSLGSLNNTYLGDVRVECLQPTSAGTYQTWNQIGGSSHVNAVSTADGDTSYLQSTGGRETFVMGDLLSTAGVVKAVQCTNIAKQESGSGSLQGTVRVGGQANESTVNTAAPVVYRPAPGIFELNPSTGLAWTAAEVNAMEAGPFVA